MSTKPKTDKEMILDPNSWSRWPLLPLKRRTEREPSCGLVVGDPKEDGSVYFVPGANLWRINDEFIAKNGSFIPVDELLSQGWEVD